MKKFVRKERLHKINDEVRFPEVRVIGDGEPRLMSSFEAAKIASDEGVDLILINGNAVPPIVRIEDYQKFLYDAEKKQKEQKKKMVKVDIREIQLSANIAEHDMLVKSKKALEFLGEGDKVKCVLQMHGREKSMADKGELVMLKFAKILEESGSPEALPKYEGGKWLMIVKPKK